MTLSKSSLAVRYYVFLLRFAGNEGFSIEYRLSRISNVCQFARAIVFRTIGMVVVVGFFVGLVASITFAIYSAPLASAIILVGFGLSVGVIFVLSKLIDRASKRPDGVILTYIKAAKRGICPLLTIERE